MAVCFGQHLYAQQISVDNSISPQDLIENNLVQGCVEVSNIVSNINGDINGISSYGYFEKANSNFPFENGVILSTGNANSAGNTTNANDLNDGEQNWGTDPDLESALGITNTLNATSIEFNFVSISNLVQFNYILASEEYFANYPCEYSDGFAFLIKRSGTSDPYINVAVIPGTSIPVNTNTIHEEIVGFCPAENEQYFDGYNLGDTNFNGRTTVLTASASILPNVEYHIKLIIADQTDENFDSAVFIQGNSFNATVNLGPDISTCADSITLNGNIENPLASYAWYNNDVLLPTETSDNLTVTNSGNYAVEITIPLNNITCVIRDDINITLNSEQTAEQITDILLCDDISNDGIETFDLTIKDNEVLASVPASNYAISYHYTSSDAQNNINPITTQIQNTTSPQTIFVSIQDIDNGCLAYTSFNLVVNPLPTITNPTPFDICDDDADGFMSIDLTIKNDEITNGNPNLIVTYHYSQVDADNGENAIPSPYVNTNTTEQIFIRVIDSTTGCTSATSLIVSVLDAPNINFDTQTINACEQDGDGFESFDLTSVIDDVLQGLTGVTTTFHLTFEDSQTGNNPIVDLQNFQNTSPNVQIIYIRVTNDSTGCASLVNLELHSNVLITGIGSRNYYVCDDISNDGIADFNLVGIEIMLRNSLENVIITFYETESDQLNDVNPIDQVIPYTVNSSPHTIYATLDSFGCLYFTEITLHINPPVMIEPFAPVNYCDTDDDGFTSIELDTFNDTVSVGINSPFVSYFETEDDAINFLNILPPFYTNTTNPQTVYARVSDSQTGCNDIAPLIINVIPAPTVSQPSSVIICDDNQDGFFIVNLEAKISEIVSDTTGLGILFYTSENDAINNTNEINNSSAYNSNTQTIYTRIENNGTGCFVLVLLEIIVNTEPVFPNISDFTNCETDGNQIADFFFIEKDLEILNGQPDKQVLYFENALDAINRTNVIDKNLAYQNITSPQTIFVRVENLTDQSCFGTSAFELEVGSIPIFNPPLDWFVCDDVSNDGFETFDLSVKIDEISANSPENLTITLYTTLEDAEGLINEIPLIYTNTNNPQQIYARVDNGTYCYAIAEFGLNVIQVPLVNTASAIELCDTDYDGSVSFDLTISEIEVLDIRQDDLVITYHETIEDVEAGIVTIPNPESYNNIENPQTVYIKINNTISNCYAAIPIELIVNLPPMINNIPIIEICDNDSDTYNLSDAIDLLIDSQDDITVTFYTNTTDAQNAQNAIVETYSYNSNNDTIFVRAESSLTNCFAIASFNLTVNPIPIANIPPDLEACDDDYDRQLIFDLLIQTPIVLGTQNPNSYTISYFELLEEAQDNTNPILDLNYNAFDGQTIYVRIENDNTGCFNTTSFMTFIQRKPIIDIPDQTVCIDNLPLFVSAETSHPNDSYLWSTNETSSEIEITEIGNYSVTVTSAFGCSTTSNFNVIESEQATIEFTETVDFSNPNNITITISGIGNYLYVLDNGVPQESNFFGNVSLGLHVITVIDLNGCASTTKEIVIIDTPLFVTPNNDGYFDTWHITGVNQLPGTVVFIYDRYGKLLKTLSHTSNGWDGTYRGEEMPTSDYWFLAKVVKGNSEFDVKGHFTLKR